MKGDGYFLFMVPVSKEVIYQEHDWTSGPLFLAPNNLYRLSSIRSPHTLEPGWPCKTYIDWKPDLRRSGKQRRTWTPATIKPQNETGSASFFASPIVNRYEHYSNSVPMYLVLGDLSYNDADFSMISSTSWCRGCCTVGLGTSAVYTWV